MFFQTVIQLELIGQPLFKPAALDSQIGVQYGEFILHQHLPVPLGHAPQQPVQLFDVVHRLLQPAHLDLHADHIQGVIQKVGFNLALQSMQLSLGVEHFRLVYLFRQFGVFFNVVVDGFDHRVKGIPEITNFIVALGGEGDLKIALAHLLHQLNDAHQGL